MTAALSPLSVALRGGTISAADSQEVPGHLATAKRCIYLFLCGGPSQPDLWDLKPDAPLGIRSSFDSIETSVPGLRFGALIPQVAKHAHRMTLIRSMTHTDNNHEGGIVHTLLGQLPSRPGEQYISRSDHPGLGGILHKVHGQTNHLPPWVILPRPFGTSSPPYKGQSAGFLGSRYDPLTFDKEKKGSLSDSPLRLDAVQLPTDVATRRFQSRRRLLDQLEQESSSMERAGGASRRLQSEYEQAMALLSSGETSKVFSLENEPAKVRDRYGRNEYGQSLLMARRLVEAGVRMVNVFWTFYDTNGCQFNLWDNHGVPNDVCGVAGQKTGIQQLTYDYCTPSFDRSFSALLEDLSDRGLLDDTLVVVAGEFGRTPKINANSGRDHWAACYTQLLAGGGVRGGQTYGESDRIGAYVKDRPVTPNDFAATILHAFGLPPETAVPDMAGRPNRISEGTPLTAIF